MEVRLSYGIFLYLVQLVIFTVAALQEHECRLCKPGYYASRLCTETHDTVCKPCSTDTFSPKPNVLRQCSPCSKCDVGEFVFKKCSKSKDIVCKSCDTFKGIISYKFVQDCRYSKYDQTKLTLHSIYDGKIPNRHKRNYEKEKNNVVDESSGETIIEENDVINATSELEGSGVSSEIDYINDINATYVKPVLLPEDGDKEDETAAELSTSTITTTVRTEVIKESDEGIILKNASSGEDKSNIILRAGKKEKQLTTTRITVTTTEVTGSLIVTDNIPEPIEEQEDVSDETNQKYRETVPHAGASQGKENKSEGTSIGVVVTVGIIAALVFFIVGFLASKYWSGRRERTFNVREAEGRKDKNSPVEINSIEYKDAENKTAKSIYDEIPAKTNGSSSGKITVNDTETDPVYSKPIKRNTVTNVDVSPPVAEGASKVPPSRPPSDIQYMDEDGAGDESATLLPKSSLVGNTVQGTSPASSKQSNSGITNDHNVKDTQEVNDESAPMLGQSSESHTS